MTLFQHIVRTLVGAEPGSLSPPEVVIWPAASNDRRLVAVCSRCSKTLRAGFTADALRGHYDHVCDFHPRSVNR